MSDNPTPAPTTTQSGFYSCFISYAHKEDAFAEKLHNDLEAHGVSCWKDTYDMQAGKFYRPQIGSAIKKHDKLILICSEVAVAREGVIEEIIGAMNRERETHTQKLFPITIDGFIYTPAMLDYADEQLEAGAWPEDWVRYVKAYHIPDFSQWQNKAAYQKEFAKLLRDLQQPPKRQ